METKNCLRFVKGIQSGLGYSNLRTVEPLGYSGGLAIFWKESIHIDFLQEDKNLIDMKVRKERRSWYLTCVYGHPATNLRPLVWERLERIGVSRKELWCMIGDFNEILSNDEKKGGVLRQATTFRPFRTMLENCDMKELGGT